MTDKNALLEEMLKAMIAENETITARAVVRRSEGVFKHATDITRNAVRRKMVEGSLKNQETIRAAVQRSSKKSRAELERQVATKNAENDLLKDDKELLVASHRAMILAVAEMGGFSTWKKFFLQYQSVIDSLEKMGALPKADVVSLHSKGAD
jgi:hypothetical protein